MKAEMHRRDPVHLEEVCCREEKMEREKNVKKKSQGKDPRTLKEHSQGVDPRTLKCNSQGVDPRIYSLWDHCGRKQVRCIPQEDHSEENGKGGGDKRRER